MADDEAVPAWWIVVFVLVVLGIGAGAVLLIGGDLLGGTPALIPV